MRPTEGLSETTLTMHPPLSLSAGPAGTSWTEDGLIPTLAVGCLWIAGFVAGGIVIVSAGLLKPAGEI